MSYFVQEVYGIPGGFETLTVADTAIGITATLLAPTTGDNAGQLPQLVYLGPLETAQIRYHLNGTTPTAGVGHVLEFGQVLVLRGTGAIRGFRAIRTGATSGSLPVTVFF